MSTEGEELTAVVQSGYGAATEEPFVSLRFGDRAPIQMMPAKARTIAFFLLEGAESAEQDAFLLRFFEGKIGTTRLQAAQVLAEFRQAREEASSGH